MVPPTTATLQEIGQGAMQHIARGKFFRRASSGG